VDARKGGSFAGQVLNVRYAEVPPLPGGASSCSAMLASFPFQVQLQ
jgi:hypothetical protein